jgi:putative ABC transport system permease protein
MLRMLYRQLAFNLFRTALTVAALAAVVAVILVLEGLREGMLAQSRSVVMDRNADLIVTQSGIANMTAARSILPQFARLDVEATEGVAVAHPLTAIPIIYDQGGRRTPIFLLVYDTGGGPRRLIAGRMPEVPRDIVVDRSVAKIHNLRLGDPFIVSDFEFRVAGIATGASVMFTPFAFIRFDDLIDFYFESDVAADISSFPLLSFLLIALESGADRAAVAARIEASVPAADVFMPETLADNDAALSRALFGPILGVLTTVGYLIGILVTAIVMFAAVHARRRNLGLLKALGFSPGFLSRSVVLEAVVLALIAIPFGALLAAGIAVLIEAAVPLYLILPIEPVPAMRTAIACLMFAVVGALAPVGLVRRIEPSLVFRS